MARGAWGCGVSAKCPTCGQAMLKVEGWKVSAKGLGWSNYNSDALAWFADGDEGASVGEYDYNGRTRASAELHTAAKKYVADRSDENRQDVDFLAVEAAALELAPTLAADAVRPGRAIPWKKGAKAAIVQRANILAAEAVKAAQGGAK